ncbi:ABC transporter permease [Actinomycetaceae bacterium TAE3-ERU4]|nr:ABC transporter permease [Actinomycetaceae bacterium TAE3-ERU4]
MFLALREIRRNKKHFSLITAVITLVGILVFFLTGLAVGLQSVMTQAATDLKADHIALADNSNNSVQASIIPQTDADLVKAPEISQLGFSALTIKKSDGTQLTSFAFAMDPTSFTAPKVTEGKLYASSGEVVVDDSLKREGYKLGDIFHTSQSNLKFKIVGFTHNQTYSSYPVIYLSIPDWQTTGVQYRNAVSAIAARGSFTAESLRAAHLKSQTISEFTDNIPGVSAQNLTFALMVGALILVSAVILGVFIYVLTLQKRKIFGVMKAQGIGNKTIAFSVFWQTAILSIAGSVLAVSLTLAAAATLPAAVPFTIPWILFGLIGAIMVAFSLLGAGFSVLSASRINPLIAIK